jgi:hypothetical protein
MFAWLIDVTVPTALVLVVVGSIGALLTLAVRLFDARHAVGTAPEAAVGRAVVGTPRDGDDLALARRIAADLAERASHPLASDHVQVIRIDPVVPDVDDRTAAILADGDLSARDLVGVVEQVADGAGSLGSFARTVEDTAMRTTAEWTAVRAAEADAYACAEAEEMRLLFAGFDEAVDVRAMATDLDRKLWNIAPWLWYIHDDQGSECPHCIADKTAVEAEHKQIVGAYDTGEIDLDELQRMFAAEVVHA